MADSTKQVVEKGQQGFPFLAVLSLIFVIAKLFGHFPYSWWIVFLPMWGPLALILGVFIVFIVIVGIVALIQAATK